METATIERVDQASLMQAENRIRNAWIAAIISGVITLVLTLIAVVAQDVTRLQLNVWSFTDVVLIFGLAFGIYRKSRTAAVIMFVYFLASKLLIWSTPGGAGVGSIGVGLLFLYFYFEGMRGTFSYHKLNASHPVSASFSSDPAR